MAEIMELTDLNFDEPREGSTNFGGGLDWQKVVLLETDQSEDSLFNQIKK